MKQILLSAAISSVVSLLIVNFQNICDFVESAIWKLRRKNKSGNDSRSHTDDNRND